MTQNFDEHELMTEEERHGEQKTYWGCFVALYVLPFFILLLSEIIVINETISALLILTLNVAAFFLTKTYFGWILVGIRWNVDKEKQPEFPFITFSAKPLPFVSTTFNSNLFWVTLFLSTAATIFVTIIYLLGPYTILGAALAISSMLCVININFFIRCHNVAKSQSDRQARTVLLDATAEFEHVDDSGEDSSQQIDENKSSSDPEVPNNNTSIQTPKAELPSAFGSQTVPSPESSKTAVQQSILPKTPNLSEQPFIKEMNTKPTFAPSFGDIPVQEEQIPTFEPPKADDSMPVFQVEENPNDEPKFEPTFAPSFEDNDEESVHFDDAEDGEGFLVADE